MHYWQLIMCWDPTKNLHQNIVSSVKLYPPRYMGPVVHIDYSASGDKQKESLAWEWQIDDAL